MRVLDSTRVLCDDEKKERQIVYEGGWNEGECMSLMLANAVQWPARLYA